MISRKTYKTARLSNITVLILLLLQWHLFKVSLPQFHNCWKEDRLFSIRSKEQPSSTGLHQYSWQWNYYCSHLEYQWPALVVPSVVMRNRERTGQSEQGRAIQGTEENGDAMKTWIPWRKEPQERGNGPVLGAKEIR